MVAFALRDSGWYLRQDIIWHKTNPMPESVIDRCVKCHEYIFLLSKSKKYYFDNEIIKEKAVSKLSLKNSNIDGKRNKRDVWTIPVKAIKEKHFATFPEELILPCVLAGCPENGIVLDPFMGSGTTAVVAKKHNRNYIGIELNSAYIKIAENRINNIEIS